MEPRAFKNELPLEARQKISGFFCSVLGGLLGFSSILMPPLVSTLLLVILLAYLGWNHGKARVV